MVKLEKEQAIFNELLEAYKDDHNEIYFRLENIARCKYLKGDGVKEFSEKFFIEFIKNGKSYNNYQNLYDYESHLKLIKLRRKIDPNFMIGFK